MSALAHSDDVCKFAEHLTDVMINMDSPALKMEDDIVFTKEFSIYLRRYMRYAPNLSEGDKQFIAGLDICVGYVRVIMTDLRDVKHEKSHNFSDIMDLTVANTAPFLSDSEYGWMPITDLVTVYYQFRAMIKQHYLGKSARSSRDLNNRNVGLITQIRLWWRS